jgi:hypothetical protein
MGRGLRTAARAGGARGRRSCIASADGWNLVALGVLFCVLVIRLVVILIIIEFVGSE